MTYNDSFNLKKMPPTVKRAYNIWRSQRARCYQSGYKNDSWQKNKIEVRYSSRDFVNWFLVELSRKDPQDKKKYGVGRINHDGHYEFKNIRLETRSENSKEVRARLKTQVARKIGIYSKANNKLLAVVWGTIDAEKFTGLNRATVSRCLSEGRKPLKSKFYFKNLKRG